jgi:hypothetical protein
VRAIDDAVEISSEGVSSPHQIRVEIELSVNHGEDGGADQSSKS